MTSDKRFFRIDDDGCVSWWIVATDLNHAKDIVRKMGAGFGQEGTFHDDALEQGLIEWSEMTPDEVSKMRRMTREHGDTRPLDECEIGDAFRSEY